MDAYAFYEFRGEVPLPPGAELLPLPVRHERESEVFRGAEVRVDLLAEELAGFLSEYSDLRTRYRRTTSTLAWLAGVSEGLRGDMQSAERHLKFGLESEPGDMLLRSNYALVLQLQERNDEALVEYEAVLADPEGTKNPVVALLAARLYAQAKRFREAYDLLEPLGGVFFNDDSYWDMLADMEELAGVNSAAPAATPASPGAPQPTVAPEPAAGPACVFCGAPVERGQRFCYKCGKPAEAPQRAKAFCGQCGTPVKQDQAFCYRCGKKT